MKSLKADQHGAVRGSAQNPLCPKIEILADELERAKQKVFENLTPQTINRKEYMKEITSYYRAPLWMAILVGTLIKAKLACRLKSKGKNEKGFYSFTASYGEEESREQILVVWNATPEAVQAHLKTHLPTDFRMLVSMAEDYARNREGREEKKVCRGIMQLLIARAVELFNKERPDETLVINGNFSLIGRLPSNGRLRIVGEVECVEGSTGSTLEIKCEECPQMEFRGMASQREGVWQIARTAPNCVFPPG